MSSPLRRVGSLARELATVRRLGGWRCFAAYAGATVRHAPRIVREGTLQAVDEVMEQRDWSLRVEGTPVLLPSRTLANGRGSLFGLARELYGRNVYLRVPGFGVGPGDTVVDLGANVGVFTVLAAVRGAHVLAVDAAPCDGLLLNATINGVRDRVTCVRAVLGNRVGLLHELDMAEVEGTVRVAPAQLLSEHGLEKVDLLKVDVEGTEFELLDGDPRWTNSVKQITMEVHLEYGDPKTLRSWLEAAGYTVRRSGHPRTGSSDSEYFYAWRPGGVSRVG